MTLIAAWKTHQKEDTHDTRGIRVISDAMLSDGSGHPISQECNKVHVLHPIIRVPMSACVEDGWESFNHWRKIQQKPFGIFFAGSLIPFSLVLGKVRQIVESLGLKPIYENSGEGDYLRTEIVRDEQAVKYRGGDSMYGGHFIPPPRLNLELIYTIVAEEFKRFYASQHDGAFVIAPGQSNHGTIRYHTLIGIAGYCDATKRFRLFKLSPEEDLDNSGVVKPVPKIAIHELADNELLLLGSNSHQESIRSKIEAEQAALTEAIDEQDRPSLARQAVIEREITSGSILGVGGAVERAEVDSDCGFQKVNHQWKPAEKLDFS
jgi:hypothetical protein